MLAILYPRLFRTSETTPKNSQKHSICPYPLPPQKIWKIKFFILCGFLKNAKILKNSVRGELSNFQFLKILKIGRFIKNAKIYKMTFRTKIHFLQKMKLSLATDFRIFGYFLSNIVTVKGLVFVFWIWTKVFAIIAKDTVESFIFIFYLVIAVFV